jgi:anaerobic selenocysteine-containing dehydrogenase
VLTISRRCFLKLFMGTIAGLSAGCTDFDRIGVGEKPAEEWLNPVEEWVPSICQQCTGGCGLLVRVVNGKAVNIAGNPLHPVNRGGVCPKGLASIQSLYDPDRIQGPLKRVGERGEGRWEPIGWDEATTMVADRLGRLKERNLTHSLLILGGQFHDLRDRLIRRFAEAYGTPNYVRNRCATPDEVSKAHFLMQGVTSPLGYDLMNAGLVVSFGCSLLEAWISPVFQLRAYGHVRQERPGNRGRMYVVDPRFSVSASKADQWIPIRPGTDAALALGMAYIIIQEGIYDRRFVENHTFGFEDWTDDQGKHHIGFKTLVLREYKPLEVSQITGVPARTIFSLARAFANARPALAIGERGLPYNRQDIYTRMAIHGLNGLSGSLGSAGCLTAQSEPPLSPWPVPELDEGVRLANSRPRVDEAGQDKYFLASDAMENLPGNIMASRPYPTDTLFLFHTNPLFSHPKRAEFIQAFSKIPFIVSFSPFMDETSLYADLILPDNLFLERWQASPVRHISGFSLFSLGRPAVDPVYNTRDTADFLLGLAEELGGRMAKAFPWRDWQDVVAKTTQGLFYSGQGYIVAAPEEEAFQSFLEDRGYKVRGTNSFQAFWDALTVKGAWWNPRGSSAKIRDLIQTSSGKFEFYSRNLKDQLDRVARAGGGLERILSSLGEGAEGDRLYLPHYDALETREATGSTFILNTYRLMSLTGSTAAQPWLQESLAPHTKETWENWVEINTERAHELGIRDGDRVWIESPKGRIILKAKTFPAVAPELAHVPFGQGHRAYGRWAQGRGSNPNDVIMSLEDTLKGYGILTGARVKIRKA